MLALGWTFVFCPWLFSYFSLFPFFLPPQIISLFSLVSVKRHFQLTRDWWSQNLRLAPCDWVAQLRVLRFLPHPQGLGGENSAPTRRLMQTPRADLQIRSALGFSTSHLYSLFSPGQTSSLFLSCIHSPCKSLSHRSFSFRSLLFSITLPRSVSLLNPPVA